MKLTRAHVDFYTYHKGPKWVKAAFKTKPEAPIPDVDPDPGYCKSNTLSILRSVRRREGWTGVMAWMRSMAKSPGTTIRPATRAAACRKWLAKIEKR